VKPNPSSKDFQLVWGAAGIGAELNISRRSAYNLLQTGKLDRVVKKVGRQWCAERGRLRRHFLEGGRDARATAP